MATVKPRTTTAANEADDLKKEVERLKKENEELANKLEVSSSVGDEGYLVIAPRADYKGITMGIAFNRGMAFIPKKSRPAAGIFKNKKGGNTIKDPAKYVATLLEKDFGYQVIYVDGSDESMQNMRALIEKRDNEFREAMQQMERSKIEDVLLPNWMNK